MLDSYIIEELKRREKERVQRERQRPTLDLPLHRDEKDEDDRNSLPEDITGNRVVQIDL
jgi:hypothetical protein